MRHRRRQILVHLRIELNAILILITVATAILLSLMPCCCAICFPSRQSVSVAGKKMCALRHCAVGVYHYVCMCFEWINRMSLAPLLTVALLLSIIVYNFLGLRIAKIPINSICRTERYCSWLTQIHSRLVTNDVCWCSFHDDNSIENTEVWYQVRYCTNGVADEDAAEAITVTFISWFILPVRSIIILKGGKQQNRAKHYDPPKHLVQTTRIGRQQQANLRSSKKQSRGCLCCHKSITPSIDKLWQEQVRTLSHRVQQRIQRR